MNTLLRFLVGPVFAAVSLVVGSAGAQTITLSENTGYEVLRVNERSSYQFPLIISRQDCFDSADERHQSGEVDEAYTWLRLSPTVTGFTNSKDAIEVWVSEGADCTMVENRDGNSPQCALVYRATSVTNQTANLYINPRDLIERSKPGDWNVLAAGAEDTCDAARNQVERNLSIHLLFIVNGSNVASSIIYSETSIDLLAPAAPDTLEVGAGDEHIFFEWEIESTSEEADTEGFTFYCVPSGTEGMGFGGAPAVDEALSAMAGAGSLSCGQTVLFEGEVPGEEAEQYKCGEATGRTTREGQTDEKLMALTNGTTYAVSVATVDAVGNSGELSPLTCTQPYPVTTFYEGYQRAGGKGGGGFCQWRTPGAKSLLWLLFGAALVMISRRRGRRA